MNGLNKGDLAMIMDAFKTKGNIGKQVILVAFVPPKHTEVVEGAGVVFGGGNGVWVVRGENLAWMDAIGVERAGSFAACDPFHLWGLKKVKPLCQLVA